MTNRLYYDDSYLRAFESVVSRVEPRDGFQAIWLHDTGFYPTSGGQPFDTGTLNGATVLGVEVDAAGDVMHLVQSSTSFEVGRRVEGAVNWSRRFDHMQQHTGQHLLSAAFDRLFGVTTLSFHLGAQQSTIDLSRDMTSLEMTSAEDEANRVVWEDRAVTIRYAPAADAQQLPLRKEPAQHDILRLIDVEGFDLSACGGTHVSRTGAVGLIAVDGSERWKGGVRLSFVCGGRALSRFRELRDSSRAATRLLSVLPGELPAAIERMQSEGRDQRRRLLDLRTELAAYRVETLVQTARETPQGRLILHTADDDANGLKALALSATARPGVIAVITSRSTPALVVVARSRDLALSAQEIVGLLINRFGGRGGGKPDLAQAGGLQGSSEAILEHAVEAIRKR
jgi:alanyl-tRNA synthetase